MNNCRCLLACQVACVSWPRRKTRRVARRDPGSLSNEERLTRFNTMVRARTRDRAWHGSYVLLWRSACVLPPPQADGKVVCTWLGHAAFQLTHGDFVCLVDPWLENPKAPEDLKVVCFCDSVPLGFFSRDLSASRGSLSLPPRSRRWMPF